MNAQKIQPHATVPTLRKLPLHRAGGPAFWLCAILSGTLHAALLLAWQFLPGKMADAPVAERGVEVSLVDLPPAGTAPATPPPALAVETPNTEPIFDAPKKDPALSMPEAPSTTIPPPISRAAPSAMPKFSPAKTATPRAAKSGGGVGMKPRGGSGGDSDSAKSTRASYAVPPVASYPATSRAAGEEGVVILRLTVDAHGRPTAVRVVKSSGHPRLDRAAVEAGWRSRVRDAIAGAQLDAPVRFNLRD